jgi:hypothetical protein
MFMPPAQCGDILMARRLRPTVIALIDGVFEQTAAVWHKELLLALEDGIRVYGSSSMGALRAAELHTYGMIGVGEIFNDYKNGVLLDDDEVAVKFIEAPWGYSTVSDPMVNIRASVATAVHAGMLTVAESKAILDLNKRTFYCNRKLARSLPEALAPYRSAREITDLQAYFAGDGYVDQKRRDAKALLDLVAEELDLGSNGRSQLRVFRSVFIRKLQGEVLSRPFPLAARALPPMEQKAFDAVLQWPDHYPIFQRLAVLLAAAAHLSKRPEALADVDFKTRRRTINGWLDETEKAHRITDRTRERFLHYTFLLYASARAQTGRLPRAAIPRRAYEAAARIWACVDAVATDYDFHPTEDRVHRLSDDLRLTLGLETRQQTEQWLKRSHLSLAAYRRFLDAYDRMLSLCDGFNMQLLGIASPLAENICWIVDALLLIGAIEDA